LSHAVIIPKPTNFKTYKGYKNDETLPNFTERKKAPKEGRGKP
jgi:hypothetical protein